MLRAVTNHPDEAFDSPRAYLVVRTAIRRLAQAEEDGEVAAVRDEVAEALWQAAVQIEDGNLGDAARAAGARQGAAAGGAARATPPTRRSPG